ncbi:unnamed protein product [Calicophoron daubneyi]|uniref:SCP domain-containing protein n=1 Tax=Calicophoron daubneyi TaxID=300641 RepID=A0AAV2TI74_CALDB
MDEEFNVECLTEHNRLRALHGCPPLVLDSSLAKQAQEHTEKMAQQNGMYHCLDESHGENLCIREVSQPKLLTGRQATLRWYSEIAKYDFSSEQNTMAGHFTQIIWKGTTRAGFGRTVGKNGCATYIAGYYAPMGNYTGRYRENVPPPLNGSKYMPNDEEMGW